MRYVNVVKGLFTMVVISLFICGIVFLGCSCNEKPPTEEKVYEEVYKTSLEWHTIIKEGCEYWVYSNHLTSNWGVYSMCHSGTCSNPIHHEQGNSASYSMAHDNIYRLLPDSMAQQLLIKGILNQK